TSVCERIMQQLSGPGQLSSRVDMLSMSSFYRRLTDEERKAAQAGLFNFDHPDAFDFDLMVSTLQDARMGKPVRVAEYDPSLSLAAAQQRHRELALVDVLLAFCYSISPGCGDLFDVKLFVDCDSDTRLARRVRTDLARGRSLVSTLNYHTEFVKPAFEGFCLPTKKYADLVLPRGPENLVAVELMVPRIRDFVAEATQASPSKVARQGRSNGKTARHLSESAAAQPQVSRPH
uniref:uridine/cytidine kinase n=1 Tax=Macrostomum lignano TaxID=282301 RepID=A0A1I8II08_9PLAT